jgi:methylthioribulose-1-phosphate dehydratase
LLEADPRDALVATMRRLHARGWAEGTGGNFSLVLGRDPLRLLMAPSGVDKGLVEPHALIEVDDAGQVSNGDGRASAEFLLHRVFVRERGAGAVLHTHSVTATVVSLAAAEAGAVHLSGLEMLKGLSGVSTHEHIERIPVLPNTQDMATCAEAVAALLSREPAIHAVLLAGHGLYTWGRDLAEAERHVQILEFLLAVHWQQRLLAGGS